MKSIYCQGHNPWSRCPSSPTSPVSHPNLPFSIFSQYANSAAIRDRKLHLNSALMGGIMQASSTCPIGHVSGQSSVTPPTLFRLGDWLELAETTSTPTLHYRAIYTFSCFLRRRLPNNVEGPEGHSILAEVPAKEIFQFDLCSSFQSQYRGLSRSQSSWLLLQLNLIVHDFPSISWCG